MTKGKPNHRNPWAWIPSVYLAEGLPYVVVMTVSVILYKGLGISNTDIALYTSWLYLPWVIKPLWSPIVDILKTRRMWIWMMQLVIGAGLAGIALTLPGSRAFQYSLVFFYLLAFGSATQDIAIDGFYLLATTEKEQSYFVGIRTTFYRIAMICGQGLLVMLAGTIQDHTGLPKVAIEVHASADSAMVQSASSFANPSFALDGPLRVVCDPPSLQIPLKPQSSGDIKALLAQVKSNNLAHAFYAGETKAAAVHSPSPNSQSAWKRVVTRLEEFLKVHFGKEIQAKSDLTGNVGTIHLRLSKPPGHPIVVMLGSKLGMGLKSGDEKSFSVVEGSRITFDDSNWNMGAVAAIQLDPKLANPASSVLELRSGNIPLAWGITFSVLAAMFLFSGIYHRFILPYPASDQPGSVKTLKVFWTEFFKTFAAYFKKGNILSLLLFLVLYRFAEAQLVKMVAPFLLDAREAGGLGLTTAQFGFVYGTVGIAALTCGGLLGGIVAARKGLKFWLWWMVLAIHLPDAVFVYLAYARPDNLWIINTCVAVEQFGYGFGFTAYMLYMIYISRGNHPTAHYAICTGFMALGMMLPGMFSGWLEDIIGYQHFFVWVLLATIPGFAVVKLIPLDADFGKKSD